MPLDGEALGLSGFGGFKAFCLSGLANPQNFVLKHLQPYG